MLKSPLYTAETQLYFLSSMPKPADLAQHHQTRAWKCAAVAHQLGKQVSVYENLHSDTNQNEKVALRPCAAIPGTKRYAVIGGGFAGVATAHSLAATASAVNPVVVHLYDLACLVSVLVVHCYSAPWQPDELLHMSLFAHQYKIGVCIQHS